MVLPVFLSFSGRMTGVRGLSCSGGVMGTGGWPGWSFGGNVWMTGLKRSWAVWPTICRARFWFLTPGSSTTIVLPWRWISGSATPRPSTRLRMISMAWLRVPPLTLVLGLVGSGTVMCRTPAS